MDKLVLKDQIEDLLYLEADLLDQHRYDEWLELLADDIEYVMPIRRNVSFSDFGIQNTRPGQDVCWFDEDKETLTKRVRQLQTGQHWAEEPISRSSHLVTNIRVLKTDAGQVQVSSRFLLYRNRMDTESDFFVGQRNDTLVLRDGWKFRRRQLLLDQSTLLAKNLSIIF